MNEITSGALWKISEKLISFNTVSSKSNLECAAYLSQVLEDIGLHTQIEKEVISNVIKAQVLAWAGPAKPGGLMLSGHLDVVPFENQPGWTKDALNLTLCNEKIYGRGTCDMKLFAAQCAVALKEMDLNKLKKPLVLYFTCDEEIGCLGAKRLGPHLPQKVPLPLPQSCVIGEPTGFDIISSHKGIGHLKIIIEGGAGHSSRPYLGKNALLPLGPLIEIIKKLNLRYQAEVDPYFQKLFPDFPYNYLHLATIHGGLAANMIPERCEVVCSWRSFPGEEELKVKKDLELELNKSGLLQEIKIEEVSSVRAMKEANNSHMLEILQKLARHPEAKSAHYATDGGPLSQQGIDCFVCGPGSLDQAHVADEFMPLKDFVYGPSFIKSLINQSCT